MRSSRRFPRQSLLFFVLALPSITACGERGSATAATVRDSAGIRIVESAAPEWGERVEHGPEAGWRVVAEPFLTIGTLEGDDAQQFFRLSDATRLPDGRVAVANRGTGEIRVFGPDGAHLVSMGGQGRGPGEFRLMAWLQRRGDSLVVFDPLQHRLSTYLSDGTFVASLPVEVAGVRFPDPSAILPDGQLLDLWRVDAADPQEIGHIDPTVGLVRYVPGGAEAVDTMFAAPGTETLRGAIDYQGRQVLVSDPVPFGRTARAAVGGGRIWFGNGDGFEVTAVEPGTGPAVIGRRLLQPRPVTPRDWERYIETTTAGSTAPDAVQEQALKLLDQAPRDRNMPAYSQLLADAAGNAWVENYRPEWERESSPRLWSVFAPDGRWLGEVEVPEALRVFEIGEDYLLGLVRDEMDIEYVVMHPLEKHG